MNGETLSIYSGKLVNSHFVKELLAFFVCLLNVFSLLFSFLLFCFLLLLLRFFVVVVVWFFLFFLLWSYLIGVNILANVKMWCQGTHISVIFSVYCTLNETCNSSF